MSPGHTEQLLDAPILPALARLAAPGLLLVVFQSAVSIADTHFVGRLGTEPLAGLALVFPLLMLLQMTSAGAMGGGVSSAIARALGRGDRPAARAFVVHGTVIALAAGLAFTLLLLAFGREIYRLLGGGDATLGNALAYSNLLFSGAVLIWLANTFASVLRGSGNTLAPALVLVAASLVHIPLSGALTLGAGPFPRLGIAGAAIAYLAAFSLATVANAAFIWKSPLCPTRADLRLEARRFAEILRVGAVSSLNAVQTVLTAVILTGLAGRYGVAALAGYGVAVRLELLQVPLVFAIGQALVVLVGINVGAGRAPRAKRFAWTGAALATAICLAIGATVAILPQTWVALFSDDAAVRDAGARYLRIVGPFFPFLGIGIALYFASQGAGRVLLPVLAGTARLAIVIAGGFAAVALGAALDWLFAVIAAGMIAWGALTAWAVRAADW
ncbi:MAG: MATE family efflux transporter, partial [Betaproteobacteria bacterium]|nr:MATE family efflux transporter [Betaproteobacteria bacterium]